MAETISGLAPTNQTLPFTFVGSAPNPGTDPKGYVLWDNAKRNYDRVKAMYEDYLARAANVERQLTDPQYASLLSDPAKRQSVVDTANKFKAQADEVLSSMKNFAQSSDYSRFFQPAPSTPSSGGTGSPTGAQIPFKAGLTDAQKQGITTLSQKPVAQWTATDKANWNYATNNAPLPTQGTGMGTTPTQTPPASPTGTQGPTAGSTGGLQFYRVGQDIYDAATGRKLGPTEWNSTWSGRATEVSAPSTPGQPASGAGTSGNAGPSGTAGTGTGAGTAGTGATKTPQQERDELAQLGIDVSQLDDNQVGLLYAQKQVFDTKVNNDQAVLPKQLTADELAKFNADAASEINPYYAERLKIGQKDLLDTFADITNDTQYKSQQLQQQMTDEQKAQAQQMADAGLTFSGLRKEAQQKLAASEQGIVRSQASQIAQNLRDQAKRYEQTYGSQELSKLKIPELQLAGVQVQPYSPYGNLMGTEQKQQTTDIAQRASQLQQQELEKRMGLAFNVQPSSVA